MLQKNIKKIDKMVEAARLYYEKGLTQQEISDRLGTSRSSIAMLLLSAHKKGLIDIKVKDPTVNNRYLSELFKQRFHLTECKVIPSTDLITDEVLDIIIFNALESAVGILENSESFGVGWGSMCSRFMQLFPDHITLSSLDVIPLFGAPVKEHECQLNECIKSFAYKTGSSPTFAYFPEIAASIEDKILYNHSDYYHYINQKWSQLDFILFSVENAPREEKQAPDFSGSIESLRKIGDSPVACYCAHRINMAGRFLNDDYDKMIIGISEEQLKRIRHQMCIATGPNKLLSTLAALNTGLISHLIIDESLARRVLDIIIYFDKTN